MIAKTLKLALVFAVLLFIGCSVEQVNNNSVDTFEKKINETDNNPSYTEAKTVKSKKGSTQNNYNERSSLNQNLIYYRVSFYSATSSLNENTINNSFSNTTIFTTYSYITSEPHTFVWVFFEGDQSIVDSLIINNSLHIEESVEPTVFKITYDSTLTSADKATIRGGYAFLINFQPGVNEETWIYRDCCINGDPCGDFINPDYDYFDLVSEQILQW